MSQGTAVALGAIAGATIFLGLPVARMHGLPKVVQGFLNAFATGILMFLLWDTLSHAGGPVEVAAEQGQRGTFAAMAVIFALGVAVGLLGFALHNITEGFGIAAPMTTDTNKASWGFLGLAGLIGGGPTFLGTWIGYLASSTYFSIAFLAVAAGALLYVLNELFNLGRKISTPTSFAWGLLLGFLTAYATDLFLTVAAGA